MKILVVGSGGREHAIAWKLAQSEQIQKIYIAPGNAGTAIDNRIQNININSNDIHALLEFAISEQITFTVVGPEAPLAAGIVDLFRSKKLDIFGPTKQAAMLEYSKAFAKDFMLRHDIPTAFYQIFDDKILAKQFVYSKGAPIVIKDDGLAAGKGVVVAMELQQALDAIDLMLDDNRENNISNNKKIVIEEFLHGEEASFIVMVDGKNILPLATSQDHKRLLDNDKGPNTGGMGAYSPAPVVTPETHAKIMREIIEPTIRGMEQEGVEFTGFLYAGVMINEHGDPKNLEFNCRMGDPETQVIMARLKTDLVDMFKSSFTQTLDVINAQWDRRSAIGVVLAAHGYPEKVRNDDEITGANIVVQNAEIDSEHDSQAIIFHAGSKYDAANKTTLTNGGRVLCVVALSDNLKQAKKNVYSTINTIKFDGMQYRNDIGNKAIK
jgi:phosphoribosylamine---glycine ligase